PEHLLTALPTDRRQALLAVLAQDPRPSYQNDPDRVYGMGFAGFNVQFTVQEDVLTVSAIDPS
ncbi:MAG: tRNA (N6-threonylcarbamoyladenosine(37)-N6)-methyltransferase TrmO, partial [Oscillospiraceae bacterium]|nr:tRNA (N6-threonylcarbamoyladenosine(37)-N6)-methyltransferase TrmO [Oscillospiraceae bacterium]